MLYRPEAFEPLTEAEWDAGWSRDAIAAIVADVSGAFDADGLWPADEWDAWTAPVPMKNLYVGGAGVVWALDALRRRGYAEPSIDLVAAAHRALAAWRDEPDFPTGIDLPRERDGALFTGETGILVVAWRLEPRADLEDEILARVRGNVGDANDVMWGTPGMLLAARALLDATGDDRWRAAWCDSAEAVWVAREADGFWTQRLHGAAYRGLGPLHGVVGNSLALLQGGELLADDRREALTRQTAELLARTAVREDGLVNWPLADGADLVADDGEVRVQFCAGAPGIVFVASRYLDDELLLGGAELVWRAGPPTLAKGAGICHGTAGNGYAFLKVFERTGDERWLERARRFAVHALEQVEHGRVERGRGRYSLWTGDLGAALYAADCLDVRSAYPILDGWD